MRKQKENELQMKLRREELERREKQRVEYIEAQNIAKQQSSMRKRQEKEMKI